MFRFTKDILNFRTNKRGSTLVIFGISLPILIVAVAGSVELAEVGTAKNQLQGNVDAGALKGARELGTDQSAATTERARLLADTLATSLRLRWTITTTALGDPASGSVTVNQQAYRPSFFANLLPPGGFHLKATATATANSTIPLCVLALKTGGTQVLSLQQTASLTASACLAQSDSDLAASGTSSLTAASNRSVGAASGNIYPAPITDAPIVPDPFTSMPINVPLACSDQGITVQGNSSQTLMPGTHCGDVTFSGSGSLTLAPGEHYFVNANLVGSGSAQVTGTDVVLVLKGTSLLNFSGNAGLNLSGRQSGSFSGFAIIGDRSYTNAVSLSTTSAHQLLGTVYLPAGTLAVSGNGNRIADQSPWTVVVANQLQISGSAQLIINSSYFASSVPVPVGVGPAGSVQLIR